MNKLHTSIHGNKILILLIPVLIFNLAVFAGEEFESYDHINDCECYSSGLSTSYIAVEIDDILPHLSTAYQFTLVDIGGDLTIDSYDADPNYTMTYNSGWGGYMQTVTGVDENYNPITYAHCQIVFEYDVNKADIEQGATRTYKLRYKRKTSQNGSWSGWTDADTFTVGFDDITVGGSTGTLCNSSQSYPISAPTGYTINWSFSNSNLVTSSSGSGTSASLTGTCNAFGDGTLTYTMTKTGCVTYQTSKTINVNGPDPTDLELNAYYTNGSPAPKGGSTYLLCANTHYHIYLDNDISYSCGVTSLTWTIPSGWTKNYQSSNMISIYTGSSPGGQVSVKGQSCCSGCGSNMSLLTGYFGIYYSCGGYYMASPNPGSDYVDIDFTPEAVELKMTSSSLELEIKLVDKMGTVLRTENVYSFPHRINTSKLKEGNYIVLIRDKKASTKAYDSFQILVEH